MKTILYIQAIILSVLISSCGTTKFSADYDDLYYSAKKDKISTSNQNNSDNIVVNHTTSSGYIENNNNTVVLDPYYREEETNQDIGLEYGNDAGLITNNYSETNELAGELEDQVVYSDDDDYAFDNIYSEESLYNLEDESKDAYDDEVSYSDRIDKFNEANNSSSETP